MKDTDNAQSTEPPEEAPDDQSAAQLHPYDERPPHFLFSKMTAIIVSAILYTILLFMVQVGGCQALLNSRNGDKFTSVKFVEHVPRNLDQEKHEGSDPTQKPDPDVAEFIPPIAEPAEVTEIDRDEPDKIPAAESTEPKNVIATGSQGKTGTGIIGDRTKAGRKEGIRLRGGSGASENAVEAALRWLAEHQDDEGKWHYIGFTRHCPPDDVCRGTGTYRHSSLPGGASIGVTGLTFLAFLGAGNTHLEGDHKQTAAKALNWLLSIQDPRAGSFNAGKKRTSIYNHAIATLALAECYAMTRDAKLRPHLVRAVGFLNQAQQRNGGWDYQDIRTNRNDTSVTGWVVMAYKSARSAGIDVPNKTINGLRRHFDRVTSDRGYTCYTSPTSSPDGMALNAVGMLANLYLGADRTDRLVRRQTALLLKDPPAWHKLAGRKGHDHSMYYWYYGTLAMYQVGGREWAVWNSHMRDMLIRNQCTEGHARGSWDPEGYWAKHYAGRVYSTALCTLNLEIYYRYLPLHQRADGLGVTVALAEELKNEKDPAKRIRLLRRMLSLSHPDVDNTLKTLLNDPDPTVRFTAAKELAERGDSAAIPFLVQALAHDDDFVRFGAIRALGQTESLETIPPLISALTDALPGNADRAAQYLRTKTGQNFGFNSDFTNDEKSRIISTWKTWWDANREKIAEEPPVQARVLAARDKGERVLIKLQTGGPLKTGMRLSVYRAGKVAGYLRVDRVMEAGMAEASTLKWLLQTPIRTNDSLKNLAAISGGGKS